MMRKSCLAAATFLFCSPALADCPVADFMVKDNVVYTSDDLVRLSVLSEAENITAEDERKKVDASALIPGYFEGAYSSDSRRSILSRQYRLLDLELTKLASRTLVQSNLSDQAPAMYEACLKAHGLLLKAPSHAKKSGEFFISLVYNPGPGGEAVDMFVEGRPRIFVTNGSIPESYWPFIPKKISPQEEISILVHRDIHATTQIVANIGLRKDEIMLPPVATHRLDFFLKSVSGAASAWHNFPYDAKTLCNTAGPGEVLFPETAAVSYGKRTPASDLNTAALIAARTTEFETCALVQANTHPGDDFVGGYVEATVTVVAARVMPIDAPVIPTNLASEAPAQQ